MDFYFWFLELELLEMLKAEIDNRTVGKKITLDNYVCRRD